MEVVGVQEPLDDVVTQIYLGIFPGEKQNLPASAMVLTSLNLQITLAVEARYRVARQSISRLRQKAGKVRLGRKGF